MPETVQAVLFDYGLVLTLSPDPAAWSEMQRITGIRDPAFSAAYWAPRHDYDRGHLNGRQYWHAVGQQAGQTLGEAQISRLVAADTALWTCVNEPMADWARRLQAGGVATGILSNLGDEMMHGVLHALPWIAGFRSCVWSHTLKMAKPQPEIYLHAAARLGTAPSEILFVDDREDNIAGAREVGMQTLRYLDQAGFEQDMIDRGWESLLRMGQDFSG